MADTPNTAWSMLGLEPASANARMVKQAYAKKIKECRPDTDPEGFQKLHAAYQFALNWLQQQQATSEQAPGDMPLETEASAPIVEEDQSLPEHFRMAKEDLRQSIASADWTACKTKLDAWKAQIKQEPELIHAWHDALIELFNEHADVLTDYMTPGDVRWLLEANCEAGPHHFVTLWYLNNQSNKLRVLANLLLETNTQMDVPAVIKQLVRLVEILAHHDVMFAGKLLNLVYPKLPPEVREWLVPQLETRLSVARAFRFLPTGSRYFWDRKLFPLNHEQLDWNGEEFAREFRQLTQLKPSNWPGYSILRQAMPQETFDALIKSNPPSSPTKTTHHTSQSKKESNLGWLVWVALALISIIARSGSSGGTSSSHSYRLTDRELEEISRMGSNAPKLKSFQNDTPDTQVTDLRKIVEKLDQEARNKRNLQNPLAFDGSDIRVFPVKPMPSADSLLQPDR
jgi:hypothetical protein